MYLWTLPWIGHAKVGQVSTVSKACSFCKEGTDRYLNLSWSYAANMVFIAQGPGH